MQRYILSACVFPGLYLAWENSRTKHVAFAKSSSHSSSSKSSSSSSKSSMFSSKSSPSRSSSSSRSSSPSSHKSLSQKTSFRSSSGKSIPSKHIRKSSNGKRFINRKAYHKEQKDNKQMSIIGLLGLLGFVSRYFYRYEKMRYSIPLLRRILSKAEPLNLNQLSNKFDGQLVCGHGPVTLQTSGLLTDKMFGVEAASEDVLALWRKVEIFKDSSKEDEKGKWETAAIVANFHESIFHTSMMERVVLPSKVLIGEFELSGKQIMSLGEGNNIEKLSFDTEIVDETFSLLQEEVEHESDIKERTRESRFKKLFSKKENTEPKEEESSSASIVASSSSEDNRVTKSVQVINELDAEKEKVTSLYENHPFVYAQKNSKQIVYEDDFVYIVNNMEDPSEGDVRISFHQIKKILQASLVAQQKGGSFADFEIKELKGLKLDLQLFSSGKHLDVRFDFVNYIREGKLEKAELIKELVNKTKSGVKRVSFILAWIIYIIYAAIFDTIGEMLNPLNWFGKNAAQRKINSRQKAVQRSGKGTTITGQTGIISSILAAPIAGAHIGVTSLFALARTYVAILAGGALAGCLLYAIIKDQQEENKFFNSIADDDEEEFIGTPEEDEEEARIMSLIKQEEGSQKHEN